MPRILSLLTEGYADWEPALIHGTGRGHYGLEVVIATPDGAPVRSMGGLVTLPDARPDGPDGFDGLLIPGGTIWTEAAAPDLAPLLRAFAEAGRAIGAICGGTLAAARAGLLDGRAHTSNALAFLQAHAPAYRGAARYRDTPRAVADGGLVTAPGTAPASFAAAFLLAVGALDEAGARTLEAMLAREHAAPK